VMRWTDGGHTVRITLGHFFLSEGDGPVGSVFNGQRLADAPGACEDTAAIIIARLEGEHRRVPG